MAHYLLNELDIIRAFTESGAKSMSEVMHGKMRQQIRRTVFQLGLIHFFGIVGKRDALNGSIDIMGAEKVSSTVTKKKSMVPTHNKIDELAECIASESDVESECEAKELGRCIQMFVRSLPERDGNVFVRRYFFTEPVAEIAKRYSMTDNNVMVILSRTRKKLKVHLIKERFFDE